MGLEKKRKEKKRKEKERKEKKRKEKKRKEVSKPPLPPVPGEGGINFTNTSPPGFPKKNQKP